MEKKVKIDFTFYCFVEQYPGDVWKKNSRNRKTGTERRQNHSKGLKRLQKSEILLINRFASVGKKIFEFFFFERGRCWHFPRVRLCLFLSLYFYLFIKFLYFVGRYPSEGALHRIAGRIIFPFIISTKVSVWRKLAFNSIPCFSLYLHVHRLWNKYFYIAWRSSYRVCP